VLPAAFQEAKALPGNVRQRVKRAIDGLADEPRPAGSTVLDVPGLPSELRRLRLDQWRVVYAIDETEQTIDVLAVRKRPPYDYGDLQELIAGISPS
jgi:mRNA interferase RelE/StbE